MAQLPDRILSWLWSVLQQYTHAQLAYSDSVSALSAFPSLQPRTSVYTYESGHSALLLCLSGTLPVDFRGTLYRFPVEIWIPQEYGERGVAIICYVRPGDGGKSGSGGDIVTRPGQHVGVDGRIYHPYLKDWGIRERSNIVDFLRIAQDIFAREPPVISKQHQRQPQPLRQTPVPPPKQWPGSMQPVERSTSPGPPPLPAKPGAERTPPSSSATDRGPPLPPLPHQQGNRPQSFSYPPQNTLATPPRQSSQRYSSTHIVPPPLPPMPLHTHGQSYASNGDRSPVSPLSPEHRNELSNSRYHHQMPGPMSPLQQRPRPPPVDAQPPNGSRQQSFPEAQQYPPQPQYQQAQYAPVQHQSQLYPPQAYTQPFQQRQYQQPMPSQRQVPQPPPDLLTDPFDISLPASAATPGPAPPIPPNPEKEHLLSMLSDTLVSQINAQLQQNAAALAPLRAQHAALQDAHARLNAELAQLQSLDSALATNEAILHQALRDCDKVIETSKSTPQPNIDDVLVAPTVAAQQLWNLCADEAAIKEALWCLQRAVGAGRVSGTEFVRLTRGLAREAFLKMALSRKIAIGLGLDVRGSV